MDALRINRESWKVGVATAYLVTGTPPESIMEIRDWEVGIAVGVSDAEGGGMNGSRLAL